MKQAVDSLTSSSHNLGSKNDHVTQTTDTVCSLLRNAIAVIDANLPGEETECRLFVFMIRDVFAHITGIPSLLREYDSSLTQVVCEHINNASRQSREWVRYVLHSYPTSYTLLRRYYLLKSFVASELTASQLYEKWCILTASLLYRDVRFTTLDYPYVWGKISRNPVLINGLREHSTQINKATDFVANLNDDTPFSSDNYHSAMASHSLLCVIYFARAILDVHQRKKSDCLNEIQHELTKICGSLHGVFFDGQVPSIFR